LCCFLYNPAKATHIVGGEINYIYLGSNNYQIRLNIYRDCYAGQAAYDNPAYVGIFDIYGNLIQSLTVPFLGSDTLVPHVNYHCQITIPTNVCVEQTTYIFQVTLPPIAGGYRIEYQRCCRNGAILNIVDPGNTGETFTATIPNATQVGNNSNPAFTYWPPVLICQTLPISIDLSATDPDGDSLVYTLCTPYDGADALSPQPDPSSFTPLNQIVWSSPTYSLANILGGTLPLTINSHTGLLTGSTGALGCYVVGVCVEEYRNGVLISETKRDFQFNVVNCNISVVSAFAIPNVLCDGLVHFTNYSSGANHYHWDFGDPGASNDTSISTNPSYTYPGPGTYSVNLIASDNFCSDTNTVTITIHPKPVIAIDPADTSLCNNASVVLNATGAYTYNWAPAAGLSATTGAQVTASPAVTTTYSISGTDVNGCSSTTSCTISMLPNISATAASTNAGCFSNNGTATAFPPGLNYTWNGGEHTQTISNLTAGVYTVTVSDTLGCDGTATGTVIVEPDYTINTITTEELCGHKNGTATAVTHEGAGPFTYLWSDSSTVSSIINLSAGIYTVTVSEGVCNMTAAAVVHYNPGDIHAGFAVNPDIMIFEETNTCNIMDYSLGAVQWQWDFGDGTNATGSVSSHTYNDIGSYTIVLIVTDTNNCHDTTYHIVKLKTAFTVYIPNSFTPDGDGLNDVFGPTGLNIDLSAYEMIIYNRWGEEIYKTRDLSRPWNGRMNNHGDKCPMGVYAYYIYVTELEGRDHIYLGGVTLVR
jgi:gliding motility-associated-like protein